jgi:hypothetical protein
MSIRISIQGVTRILLVSLFLAPVVVSRPRDVAAASAADAEVSPAFIVPLFPQKERDLKKGFPPRMTAATFWSARGRMALTKLAEGKVKIEFMLTGLIPHGIYTLWNVLETEPFKDEPLGTFGYGQHSVVADESGRAHKIVIVDKWPGREFLLDYHADGRLSQSKGVYLGALWGQFPPEPRL